MARSCVVRFQLFGIEAVVEAASSRTRWNFDWAWRSGIRRWGDLAQVGDHRGDVGVGLAGHHGGVVLGNAVALKLVDEDLGGGEGALGLIGLASEQIVVVGL